MDGARVANHCQELLTHGAVAVDPMAVWTRISQNLVSALEKVLAQELDDRRLSIEVASDTREDAESFHSRHADPCLAAFFADGDRADGAMLAMPVAALLDRFERLLGFEGESDALSAPIVGAADRFVEAIQRRIGETLSTALGGAALAAPVRGTRFAAFCPIRPAARLHCLQLTIGIPDTAEWQIELAVSQNTLIRRGGVPAASPGSGPDLRMRGLAGSALGDIPLPIRAELVDMEIGLRRVARLAVGDELPIRVARDVPIVIEDTPIARALVGDVNDHVAMEITAIHFDRNTDQ